MPPIVLLAYYCVAILVASVLGGMLPGWLRLTHRWMECAVSLVAGVMLGVALLHLLPHALDTAAATGSGPSRFLGPLQWALGGWLAMFFVERFFCFHHHDLPDDDHDHGHDHAHSGPLACEEHGHAHSDHSHDLSWGGAVFGLTLHSVLAGLALAASVFHNQTGASWAGLGVFVAIVLHKPFDSMTIAMLMARSGRSAGAQAAANAAFAMAVPLGALLFYLGAVDGHQSANAAAGSALAFSAGMFLCISMSDLLPELQFHHHDRFKLSAALLLGLAVAWVACRFEQHTHSAADAGRKLPASAVVDVALVGEYYFGDGLGVNKNLTLGKDGAFSCTWRGCLGDYGAASGRWARDSATVYLSTATATGIFRESPLGDLAVLVHGGDTHLVPSGWEGFIVEHDVESIRMASFSPVE